MVDRDARPRVFAKPEILGNSASHAESSPRVLLDEQRHAGRAALLNGGPQADGPRVARRSGHDRPPLDDPDSRRGPLRRAA